MQDPPAEGQGGLCDGRTRVLVVEDSVTARSLIIRHIQRDPRIEVVGEAGDAYEARTAIKALSPDVITLDVEMPRMNGIEFLEKIMRLRPMPVVMLSTVTQAGSSAALDALEIGAIDCVPKPTGGPADRAFDNLAEILVNAAKAPVGPRQTPVTTSATNFHWNQKIVLIGSSTGGLDALETVLKHFPRNGPPTLLTQHMPDSFLRSFAERLGKRIAPKVQLGVTGMAVEPGNVYLAPGGTLHMGLSKGDPPRIVTMEGLGDELHTPSVDLMFDTALPHANRIVAAILTGMGRDGAAGLAKLRALGARTVAQNQESSVVYGMPRAAVEAGAVETELHLNKIGAHLLELAGRSTVRETV